MLRNDPAVAMPLPVNSRMYQLRASNYSKTTIKAHRLFSDRSQRPDLATFGQSSNSKYEGDDKVWHGNLADSSRHTRKRRRIDRVVVEMEPEDQNEVPVVEGDQDEEVKSAEVYEDWFQRLSRMFDYAEAEICRVD